MHPVASNTLITPKIGQLFINELRNSKTNKLELLSLMIKDDPDDFSNVTWLAQMIEEDVGFIVDIEYIIMSKINNKEF
jgi:hypothetical protein